MIGIFFVASACASDLNETTVLDIDDSDIDEGIAISDIEDNQEQLSIDMTNENSGILNTNYTLKVSSEIQSFIDDANSGDTIILDGYYLINTTITVDKQLNFVGVNNATVDGNSKVRLFSVSNGGVIFKNITFKNGYSDGIGGAIYGECTVINCSFVNNSAIYGGAIGQGSSAIDCSFINNSAEYGGAISKSYSPGVTVFHAFNCTFINNSAGVYGGAAEFYGKSCSLENCIFVNNVARGTGSGGNLNGGGALYGGYALNCSFIGNSAYTGGALKYSDAKNCSFVNNSALRDGGAMHTGSAVNCSFVDNVAKGSITSTDGGGALYSSYAANCSFVNNSARHGGAMYGGSAVNCSFVNNSAQVGGATSSSSNENCIFINNVANDLYYGGGAMSYGSALNCSFVNNSASVGGALWYADAKNCTFINNNAKFEGGAMSYGSALNCSFVNNSANSGGALYDTNAVNCSFVNNSALNGGAVASKEQMHYGSFVNSMINITGCWFINNSASSSGGAVESSHHYRIYNISDCTFVNNYAGNGGAINFLNQIFNVNDCTFDNNSANKGGALYIGFAGNVNNCNFTDCYSTTQGGAIYLINSELNLTLSNFTNCSSNDGSSYLESNNPSLYNVSDCIFDEAPKGISYHYSTTLTVNNLFIAKGQKGFLYAYLSNVCGPLVNKKVNFMFNGRKFYSVTNGSGIAEFNVNNYLSGFGETIISLNFTGDELNYHSVANASVYINKYFGNLTVILDGQFYNDTILKFRLVNSITNVPISGAPIKLNFSNGEIVNLETDFEGNAVYVIPFIPDTYSVDAFVDEDHVNVNNVSVENIVIKKLVGDIEVTPLNDNYTLMIRLFDPDDSTAVYRNVKVNLDVGPNPVVKEELFTNERGFVVYDLLNFTTGTYSISVTVKGDYKDFYDYYLADYVISNLLDSKLSFTNNITFEYGGFGSCNFTVEGGIVEYGKIKVVNHSEAIIGLTDNVISVSYLSVGNYVLLVETTPDEYHNPVNATLNITVNNVKSKVTLKAGVVFEYGGSASIHVVVDGGFVERNNIRVLNHPEAKISLSNQVITISGLAVGSYVLSVTSTPDSDHTAATSTVTVTVKKAVAVITEFKRSVVLKKGTLGSLKFVDSRTKKPISGMNVALKVYTGKKFITINLKTNSKGIVSYQTKKLAKGNHKIVVTASHKGYKFNSVTFSINVVKPKLLKFRLHKKVNDKRGSMVTYQVLDKKTKKGINGIKVKFMIYTGKKYKSITLKTKKVGKYKGIAGIFTNEFSVGKHKVVIEPVSIMYDGSGKTTINIKKSAKKYPAKTTKS